MKFWGSGWLTAGSPTLIERAGTCRMGFPECLCSAVHMCSPDFVSALSAFSHPATTRARSGTFHSDGNSIREAAHRRIDQVPKTHRVWLLTDVEIDIVAGKERLPKNPGVACHARIRVGATDDGSAVCAIATVAVDIPHRGRNVEVLRLLARFQLALRREADCGWGYY